MERTLERFDLITVSDEERFRCRTHFHRMSKRTLIALVKLLGSSDIEGEVEGLVEEELAKRGHMIKR